MNRGMILLVLSCFTLQAGAQIRRPDRLSKLDSDPEVVYIDQTLKDPIELDVIKDVPVFSDKGGMHRVGFLKIGQKVRLEAMSEKAYRVRLQNVRDGIIGWTAPWAYAAKDPLFVENLKKLYDRQMMVQGLIASHRVAIGMTLDEVSLSIGRPTKTNERRTTSGQTGSWEFIDYEEIKHYTTRIDPVSGQIFRVLAYVTQEEKSKTVVEFENDLVTAIQESEDRKGGNVRIVVPPLIFGW